MDFEFDKNQKIDSIDKVPEPFRGFYTQGDDGYVLADSFKGSALSIDGLNRSLKAARREADEAKRNRPDMSGFSAVGQLLGLEDADSRNPETLKSAIEKVIGESKDGKVNWDKMKKDLDKGFQTQLTAKDGELQTMSKTLQKYLVTTAAVQAIAAQKGTPELLLPHISAQTKVIKEGDEYVVRVVDSAGDPRGNAAGGFMSVEDLVKELKASPTFGRAFESEAPSGNGSKPNSTPRTPAQKQGELTPNELLVRGLKNRNRS